VQTAKLVWHRAHEAVVAEDKAGEEGEVAELRGDAALEWHVGELEAGDAPPAVVARDADPRAEGRSGSPVADQNAEGVLDLRSEGEQRSEVRVVGWWWGECSGTSRRQ
jgi:hypothetical protein